MQAVIRWTLGTSWPHSRMASPVHICCASDEKARLGRAASTVVAEARAKRSAILLVRWKVIDAFPKVARGVGRCSLGALHAVCAAACVIHHAGVTRCGCSNSADVRIKSAALPRCELCANDSKLQWLASTLPGLLRARHVDRSVVSASPSSTAIEQPVRLTRAQRRVCSVGRAKPSSHPVTSCAAANPPPAVRLP